MAMADHIVIVRPGRISLSQAKHRLLNGAVWLVGVALFFVAIAAWAQDQEIPPDATTAPPASGVAAPTVPAKPTRPKIMMYRWEEDWSVLADPALRTEPLDGFKYIPISPGDPHSYLSFGL